MFVSIMPLAVYVLPQAPGRADTHWLRNVYLEWEVLEAERSACILVEYVLLMQSKLVGLSECELG